MKKLGKLLLVAGLLFTTAACSKKDPIDTKALDKLEDVLKKTGTYKSANYSTDITVKAGGDSEKFKAHGSFVVGEQPQVSMNLELDSKDQPSMGTLSVYLSANTIYMDMLGSKMKMSLDSANLMYGGAIPEMESEADEKAPTIKNTKALKKFLSSASLSGNTIKIEMDKEKLKAFMKEYEEMSSSLSSQLGSSTYEKVSFEVKFDKKNYMTSVKMYLEMNLEKDDEKETGKATINFKLTDRDKLQSIELPADLDSYQDLESAMSGYGDMSGYEDDSLDDSLLDDGL
ncbi:MAG: hypothetical protein RR441_05750 [Longicatena sp.]